MADPLSPDRLVRALRAEGCTVREYRSWRTHNRNHKGRWGPINGVQLHHTVTSGTDGSVRLCYEGYSGLPGPLCHGVIAKDGTIYLVGNGRANHAGLGDDNVLQAVIEERSSLPSANERNTDGNARFYGFECINLGDGEDPWPDAQLEAIERASAAICRAYGWSAESVIGHKEWSYTKIDPRGFSMEGMRDRINHRLSRNADFEEDEVTKDDIQAIANAVVDLLTGPRREDLVDAIYHTDGVVKSPDHESADEPNKYWWGETYVKSQYNLTKQIEADLDAVRNKVDTLQLGGVDLDALAEKVADLIAVRMAE